jgi:ATP-dependent Clp protease protease subunit
LNEALSRHTGKTMAEVEKATDRDNYLNPGEAVEFGLIDKVVEKRGA